MKHVPILNSRSIVAVRPTARFHFDLVSGDVLIRDEVGIEADSLEQAVADADAVIAETRAGDDLPMDGSVWQLVVRDAFGVERHRLSL